MCRSDGIAHSLSYDDFLAKPMQRLSKYPLLFKDIKASILKIGKTENTEADTYGLLHEKSIAIANHVGDLESTWRFSYDVFYLWF